MGLFDAYGIIRLVTVTAKADALNSGTRQEELEFRPQALARSMWQTVK